MEVFEFYNQIATDHAELDDRMHKIIQLVEAIKPGTLLDIGCGRGELINALKSNSIKTNFIGIEISKPSREIALARGLNVIHADLGDPLPFEDESFDVVVFGEVIEHLYDPDFALDEIVRVLRPNGRLIATTPNLTSWLNRILVLFGIQPIYTETSTRRKYGRKFAFLNQGSTVMQGHIRVMTADAFSEIIAASGLLVTKRIGCRFHILDSNILTKLLDDVFCRFPSLASGLILEAVKQ